VCGSQFFDYQLFIKKRIQMRLTREKRLKLTIGDLFAYAALNKGDRKKLYR
jgi:hypothetical protein